MMVWPGLAMRAWLRDARRHRWQTGLSVLGVALGVAVVIAVDIAIGSARLSFERANQAIAGQAGYRIVGGPRGIDEAFYTGLRVAGAVRDSAPLVQGTVRLPGSGQVLQVLGVDPFAEANVRDYAAAAGEPLPWARLIAEPATGFITRATAARLGIATGERLELLAAGQRRHVRVLATWQPANPVANTALGDTIIVDIATAQVLLGRPGRLTAIDLVPPPGPRGAAELAAVRARLTPDLALVSTASRNDAQRRMTAAFETNLTALSLLALVIGMFLVYNTMSFAVLRRRAQIGVLRTLGLARRELFTIVIGEAVILGAAASVLGLALGILLAEGLLGLVTRTIDDLYFRLGATPLALTPATLIEGLALGLGASAVSAALPALEAARLTPGAVLARSDIEARTGRALRIAWRSGVALMGLSAVLFALPGGRIGLGFAGLFCLLVGYALVTPSLMVLLLRGARHADRAGGVLLRMARRGIERSLSRTGVAVAALAVAVSATIGVGIMIASFRDTVQLWLGDQLRADVYLDMPGRQTLPDDFITRLRTVPGINTVTLGRRARIESQDRFTNLFAVDPYRPAFRGFRLKAGNPDSAWRGFAERGEVLVSEPYAYRHRLGVNDAVRLRTVHGMHNFRIAGVYYEYGSDQGVVTMSRATYQRYFDDPSAGAAALYLAPGVDAAAVIGRIRAGLAPPAGVMIRSTRALREASLKVFDRTFAITGVLRLLAMVVAAVGILAALLCIQLERAREFAVLRTLGMTPGQLWRLIATESGLLGLAAGLLAIPAGLLLAWVLIAVIDRRSFGWTIHLSITSGVLVEAVVLAVVAAFMAGLYPAWRLARTPPAQSLRAE